MVPDPLGASHLLPSRKSPRPKRTMVHRTKMMATVPEEIVNTSVITEKTLRLMSGFEPPHLPLSLSSGLVRQFGSVIRVLLGVVNGARYNLWVANSFLLPALLMIPDAAQQLTPGWIIHNTTEGRFSDWWPMHSEALGFAAQPGSDHRLRIRRRGPNRSIFK